MVICGRIMKDYVTGLTLPLSTPISDIQVLDKYGVLDQFTYSIRVKQDGKKKKE